MSDERLLSPEMTNDAIGCAAPTEREPAAPPPPPSRGTALSVLWWRESGGDKEDEQKPETD
jgi:hypothetical protein